MAVQKAGKVSLLIFSVLLNTGSGLFVFGVNAQ